MANISLSKENIKYIRDAFSHFFPEDALYSADKPYTSGEFNWDNRKEFIGFVYRLTGIQIKSEKDFENIKKAQLVVEKIAETEEKTPEANRPTKEQLKTLEEEAKIRTETKQSSKERAEKNVKTAIKTKEQLAQEALQKKAITEAKLRIESDIKDHQKIQEELRGHKIYVKVEIAKERTPPRESTLSFIEQAKIYPSSFQKDLAENIKVKITPILYKKLSVEEIELLANKAAFDAVSAINDFPTQSSSNTRVAILSSLSKDTKVLPKVISNLQTAELLKKSSNELGYFINDTQLSKNILASVDENLAENVFGVGSENLSVSFSDQPTPGYNHEIDLGKLNQGHVDLLENQSNVLDNINSFAGDRAKSILTERARTFIDSKIAKLPADSVIKGIYNSGLGQQILSSVGLSKAAPITEGFTGGNLFANVIQQVPGGTAFLEGVGNFLKVDLIGATAAETTGMAVESSTLVGQVVEGVVETGITVTGGSTFGVETTAVTKVGGTATGQTAKLSLNVKLGNALVRGSAFVAEKLGFTAASAKILAMIGNGVVPVIGAIVGTFVGVVLGKIIEKINWKKIKEYAAPILGVVVGLIVLPFAGFGVAVGVAVGTTTVSAALGASTGGLTIGGVVGGITVFIGTLAKSFAGMVLLPILIMLLVIPVVVVFILFIINSGAYIVPPSLSQSSNPIFNPFVSIEKTVDPTCMNRSGCPDFGSANYHIKITAKKGVLTNIQITNKYSLVCKTSGQPIPSPDIPELKNPPTQISPSKSFEFDYSFNVSSVYNDCLIIDTVTITADAEGTGDATTSASASISVGDPPEDCPQGWPVEGTWGITQGPRGSFSHTYSEAIDLATTTGVGVTARHSGIATVVYTSGAYRPVYIDIASNCNGQAFTSRYAHLSAVSITDGQTVTMGQSIGATGSDGTGPHLHYEFFGLKMEIPYIPKSVPYGCNNVSTCGTIP